MGKLLSMLLKKAWRAEKKKNTAAAVMDKNEEAVEAKLKTFRKEA